MKPSIRVLVLAASLLGGASLWAQTAAMPKSSAASAPKTAASMAKPAPGGGAGKVWVNTVSKRYHCEGSKFYGKTKQGEYLTEAEAKSRGYKGLKGKSCSK